MWTKEEPTDVLAWFESAPESWIECRESGHSMKRMHKGYREEIDSNGGMIHTVTRRCTRCGTRRRNRYRPGSYMSLGSTYSHRPEGYETHGAGLDRQGIRQLIGGTYEREHSITVPISINAAPSRRQAG